jgi:hypothetical protein
MISDAQLLTWHKRGLIPGPDETEEAFLSRLEKLQHLSIEGLPIEQAAWQESYAITQPLFGIAPDWIAGCYSNRKLALWEGAATWIDADSIPRIQLKTAFCKGKYGLHTREEVLAHEAIHAARMAFQEPQFEEMLAYATSKHAWKRWLGPLFQAPWETAALLISMLSACIDLTFAILPLLLLSWWTVRFVKRRRLFQRCLAKTGSLTLMLFLKDDEIARGAIVDGASLRQRMYDAVRRSRV